MFDHVGVHPYSYPARPTDESTGAWNTFVRLPAVREVMVDNGDTDTSIWITEYGAPTGSSQVAVTEQEQAESLIEALGQARAWPWVDAFFVYNLRDQGDPADPEQNFGLIRADGSEKPAYRALAAAHPCHNG